LVLLQGQIKDLEIMYAKDVTEDQVEAIKKAMPRTVITVRK
jgi:environmental stress-induced protein Ves